MAFSSGVFTSTSGAVNGDGIFVGNKANTAAQLAYEKKMLYGNGISLDPSSAFYVDPKTGLTFTVKAGWGIMEGYWFRESTAYDITLNSSTSEQTFYIGVRLDTATGEYTDSHVSARTTFVPATDRVFAIIVIPANAVTLTTWMISDKRYDPAYCGTINAARVALEALQTEYAGKLAVLESTGIPIHASTHTIGEVDAIAVDDIGGVAYVSQTLTDGEQTQARTNISAASLTSGKVTPAEASSAMAIYTASHTLVLADNGKLLFEDSTSAIVVTVPQNVFPKGAEIEICWWNTGAVSIAAGSGVTLCSLDGNWTSRNISGRYGVAVLKYIGTNVWLLAGALA